MKKIKVEGFEACDGKIFTGTNAEKECEKYEKEFIINLDKKMEKVINIYNKDFFFTGKGECYIRFNDESAKQMFKDWCHVYELEIEEESVDNALCNQFYRITTDMDLTWFGLDRMCIHQQIIHLMTTNEKLLKYYR